MPYRIPENFAQTCIDLYGESGKAWLRNLPALLDSLADRWQIEVGPPYALSYNYVAPARRTDGQPVVLKAGHPNPELACEIKALRLYAGRGIARLLEALPEEGAMLLERLEPGAPLAGLADDDEATRTAAQVMRALWIPLPAEGGALFPTVEKWGRGFKRLRAAFDGGTGPFPAALVERAEGLFADLLASSGPPALLHGDLHHWNILSAQRAPWLALDPKGLAGEPEYEVGALLRNRWPPNPTPDDLRRQAARRLDILAETLGFDRARLRGWTLAQAVLSAWWTYEDHRRVDEETLAFARALDEKSI